MPQFQKLTSFTAWQFKMPAAAVIPEDGDYWKIESDMKDELSKDLIDFSISHIDIIDTEDKDNYTPFRVNASKSRFNASVAQYVYGEFGSGKERLVMNEGEWLVENPDAEFGLEVLTDEEFRKISVTV